MNESEFNKLNHLCRISLTDSEKEQFLTSIDHILSYIEQLNGVDTQGVSPCFTIHEHLESPLREDVPEEPLSRDLFLKNVPAHVGGIVRVPPILKS
ncbi:Asp-tRNA(Asn)/Glu-tRNA(Gln) amidotransferase subunit GatC [Rhabdochlamydiaceae symbiont of Dictyostelium giganteum]|uniref:Asp-tRNA(Asn)/Glu-tRNA(Gln) amidotransferase subunit GatC n=1 Tax=Rhabdochlamydiaceae symbiont of Dictyostelium giganteum TaxID=3342349 RepID=UPI00384F324C